MNKKVIIVEGIADAIFLSQLINKYFGKPIFSKPKVNERTIYIKGTTPDYNINIHGIGGFTKLYDFKANIKEYEISGFDFHVIFDTDTSVRHKDSYGGRIGKTNFLNEHKVKLEIDFSTFLLPFDNEEEGNLEDLLIKIVNKDNFNAFLACHNNYCSCLKSGRLKLLGMNELESQKSQLFNYLQASRGMKSAKELERNYLDIELWDLESEALTPFIQYLSEIFKT